MTTGWVIGIALASFWLGFALASIFSVSGRESEREEDWQRKAEIAEELRRKKEAKKAKGVLQ
jgi:hypothetical protein